MKQKQVQITKRMNADKPTTDDIRRINLEDLGAETLDIDPATIPTLIPDKHLKEWQKGDSNPYYKVQRIKYPIVANRVTYVKSFFESFLNKAKVRPIPGSKDGHHMNWGKRPPSDFALIGGKIEDTGGDEGYVYLKNYIPPVGDNGTSNERFITENKTNMIHFSLVAYTKDVGEEDPVTGNYSITVVESVRGERNDAVERDLGAMKQVTNAVESGDGGQAKNAEKGDEQMELKDMLKAIRNALTNGSANIVEVSAELGVADKMVNAEHEAGVKLADEFKKLNIKDPVAEFKALQAKVKTDVDAVFNAKLDVEFGPSKKDATGAETNALRQCAEALIDRTANADEAIKAFKTTAAAKQLAGKLASTSEGIVQVLEAANKVNAADPIPTEEY